VSTPGRSLGGWFIIRIKNLSRFCCLCRWHAHRILNLRACNRKTAGSIHADWMKPRVFQDADKQTGLHRCPRRANCGECLSVHKGCEAAQLLLVRKTFLLSR
jgi:hypothetical protein